MTWQDSLRQLDARLAAGEIGAAEYRKSRDEILAEASSGSQAVSFESAAAPKWQSTPPAEAPPAETDAETTQVVVADETTQVVTADVVNAPPPPPQQFGPPPQAPRPAPPIMGSEVFAAARPAGGGRRALWIIVPLLVVALVGAGVWWFVLRDDNPPAAQNQNQQTTSKAPATTSAAAEVPNATDVASQAPQLPGEAKAESGTMTPDQAQQQNLITPAYAKVLTDGGAKEIVYRKSAGGGYGYLFIAAPVEPAGKAPALVTATSDDLKKSGFTAASASAGQPPVYTRTDKFFRTFVTMYASGDVWVQLNVSAAPDGDENALRGEFDNVLRSMLGDLPAR